MSPRTATRAAAAPVLLVRRYPLGSFVALACLFGWAIWIGVILSGGTGGGNLPLGPVVAAFVVTSCQGRDELRSWGRQLLDWRAGARWYLLAALAPVALHVLIVLVNHLLGAPLPTPDQLAGWTQVPITFVVLLVLIGIGEEAGWTAFAAPVLLRRHGLVIAWLLASAMRIFWHLPLMLHGDLPWAVGVAGNAAFTMVTLLLLLASGGHWTLAAVWHAMLNAVGSAFFFTMVGGADKDRLDLLLVCVYVAVAVTAYAVWTHRRPRHAPRPAPPTGVDVRRPDEGSDDVDRRAKAHL